MIYPTGRAVWAAAAGAVPAFLIALALPSFWYLGLVWICALLAFLLVDITAGAQRAALTASLQAPPQAGVGAEFAVRVAAGFEGAAPAAVQVRVGHDGRVARGRSRRSAFIADDDPASPSASRRCGAGSRNSTGCGFAGVDRSGWSGSRPSFPCRRAPPCCPT